MTARRRVVSSEVTRAVKACREAGLTVGSVAIAPDGTITVTMKPEVDASAGTSAELDRWLDVHATENDKLSAGDAQASRLRDQIEELHRSGPVVIGNGKMWSRDAWIAHVRGSPINKRENALLSALAPLGTEHVSDWRTKGAGPNTLDRLVAREFIEYVDEAEGRFRLTAGGFAAVKNN